MIHPFFSNGKSILYFILVWATVIVAHLFALHFYYALPFIIAATDSIIFNALFAILSLPLWYVIRYLEPFKQKSTNILINHLTSIVLIALIWIYLSQWILQSIFSNNALYLEFLNASVPVRINDGVFYYLLTILIYYLIIYYNDLQEKLVTEARLKELITETEISLLKSQINPHFLFNSLNSISSLTLISPSKAQEMVIKLSDFLRFTISHQTNAFLSLEKELELVKLYLEIEQIRFSDKLKLEWIIEPFPDGLVLPSMLLQPIYENAIKHGVYDAIDSITIFTEGKLTEDFYRISISNNYEENSSSKKGAKLGLKNIKERLKLIYGTNQLIDIQNENQIFKVTIYIPLENKPTENFQK